MARWRDEIDFERATLDKFYLKYAAIRRRDCNREIFGLTEVYEVTHSDAIEFSLFRSIRSIV